METVANPPPQPEAIADMARGEHLLDELARGRAAVAEATRRYQQQSAEAARLRPPQQPPLPAHLAYRAPDGHRAKEFRERFVGDAYCWLVALGPRRQLEVRRVVREVTIPSASGGPCREPDEPYTQVSEMVLGAAWAAEVTLRFPLGFARPVLAALRAPAPGKPMCLGEWETARYASEYTREGYFLRVAPLAHTLLLCREKTRMALVVQAGPDRREIPWPLALRPKVAQSLEAMLTYWLGADTHTP